MNNVELQGRIHNIYTGKLVTIITLIIKGKRKNYPQVIFYPSEKELVEGYEKGDYVNISGSVKVRGRQTEDGKNYFEQFIRGYVIYPVKSEMSEKFHRDLGGSYEYINEILISGKIVSSNNKNGVLNLLVKPNEESFNIWLTNFMVNPSKAMNKFNKGDEICIKCEVQTIKKEKEGEKAKYYENLVVKYMSIPTSPEPKHSIE